MNQKMKIRELAIVLTAENINFSTLNIDVLKDSDIIPENWELTHKPIYTNNMVQLVFQFGVAIVAQTNQILFAQVLNSIDPRQVIAPQVALKYIEKFPKKEFQTISINPSSYIEFVSDEEAHRYITHNLLKSGSWHKFGTARMKAALQLAYKLERGVLNLGINQGRLNSPENQLLPIVFFAGNFKYQIIEKQQQEHLKDVTQLIQNWQNNLETFQKLVNQKFLMNL
ncbi:hypothetical protein [Mastigocoleus testarum]|uniref:Uncharacterized protein n=1 Tax=Mastigocoleus testarum BC008 TaxID=371196 RepID=A0A0V7ZTR6_9CYAN|nr:hypothetical protein [Mastigocoleus testarum]KST67851.1 hypothetical protein BC008_31160 [Mastigocoleus testarum BC008]